MPRAASRCGSAFPRPSSARRRETAIEPREARCEAVSHVRPQDLIARLARLVPHGLRERRPAVVLPEARTCRWPRPDTRLVEALGRDEALRPSDVAVG